MGEKPPVIKTLIWLWQSGFELYPLGIKVYTRRSQQPATCNTPDFVRVKVVKDVCQDLSILPYFFFFYYKYIYIK